MKLPRRIAAFGRSLVVSVASHFRKQPHTVKVWVVAYGFLFVAILFAVAALRFSLWSLCGACVAAAALLIWTQAG